MGPAADSVQHLRADALSAADQYGEAFDVAVASALRSYDTGLGLRPLRGEVAGYLAHLGPQEHAVLAVVGAVLGWADGGHDIDAASRELDTLVTAENPQAADLVVRFLEQIITDDDPAVDLSPLTGLADRAVPLATGEMRVRLGCCRADLAVAAGADPASAYAEPLRQARRFEYDDGLVALVHRRAGHAHAGCGRSAEAVDLYRAAVVHSSSAGLDGDTRDALRSLSGLADQPFGSGHTIDALRAISGRDRLLPGADTSVLETLELIVDDKIAQALGNVRTWVRHERTNGAVRDEWVARRRLGQILDRATEHGDAVEQFVRAGARQLAAEATTRAGCFVDVSRYLASDKPARAQAAAAAVLAEHADLLPDDRIADIAAALLTLAEHVDQDMALGPMPGKYALAALAAFGTRLPISTARRLLQIIEALLPRRPGSYRITDEQTISTLATACRSPDPDLAAAASPLLVDGIETICKARRTR